MKSNKKGQSIITIIFLVLIFLVVWIMVLGEQLSYWGHEAVVNNGLTGIVAFGFNNLNLLIFACLLVFLMAVGYMGFGR